MKKVTTDLIDQLGVRRESKVLETRDEFRTVPIGFSRLSCVVDFVVDFTNRQLSVSFARYLFTFWVTRGDTRRNLDRNGCGLIFLLHAGFPFLNKIRFGIHAIIYLLFYLLCRRFSCPISITYKTNKKLSVKSELHLPSDVLLVRIQS